MKRTPETELMSGEEQARAYAEADFSEPHETFIRLLVEKLKLPADFSGTVLDLGCGPCDISIRLARRFPQCQIDAVDGSATMLKYGERAISKCGLQRQISLHCVLLPSQSLHQQYDLIVSNSLLHHLHKPEILWSTIQKNSHATTSFFVMDLLRPNTPEQAQVLTQTYASEEPDILQRDFLNSLHAAFTTQEIEQQLLEANMLAVNIEKTSDRHVCVFRH